MPISDVKSPWQSGREPQLNVAITTQRAVVIGQDRPVVGQFENLVAVGRCQCHIAGMAIGHMFLVGHPRDGAPLHVTYAVAGNDRQACQDLLVHELSEAGIDVLYARELSEAEIAKLGLSAGKYRSFWPTKEL